MQKAVTLNNKVKIPAIGLGLWRVQDKTECKNAVKTALKAGYHHFDTAQVYGNEEFLGEALQEAKVNRKDIFVTTKIKNENLRWINLIDSFEESLDRLQMDYVDLLLIHFPVTEARGPAWRRMQEIYESGRAKSIGVSNYTIRHLQEVMEEGKIKPAVNQVELHVYLQQPELLEFCRKNDIQVEAYSPLAHGHNIGNPVLKAIGKKHGKSAAQIMIRWCLQVGAVPLPKSVHENRIKENIDVFDFELDAEDMKKIKELNENYRTAWDPTHVA